MAMGEEEECSVLGEYSAGVPFGISSSDWFLMFSRDAR
jgi:hypothetical protein